MPMTLRQAREKKRLTQEALANLTGLDQAHISQLENGRIEKPSWESVFLISTALGMEPQDIFPVADRVEDR